MDQQFANEAVAVYSPTHAPTDAFHEAVEVRSYEAGRDGVTRPAVILRYLEAHATRHSTELGFTPQWYVEHQSAWLVREMSLLLGDLPTIGDQLALATWVADFKRVQAQRDYVITWAGEADRLVARASARWAYVDRASGRLASIHPDLTTRMQKRGEGMPAYPVRFPEVVRALERGLDHGEPPATEGTRMVNEYTLTARDYEADIHQHVNNCVYADWLDEGIRQAQASGALAAYGVEPAGRSLRPHYLHLEYVRSLRPGAQARIRTYALGRHEDCVILWQAITTETEGGESTALRAYVEYAEHG